MVLSSSNHPSLFEPFIRGNVGCLRQTAAPDTQVELYSLLFRGVQHILNNPKLMPVFLTDLWRSGCIPALLSAPPQTAPWNVSVRASPAGTEGPFVLWRQNITSMFLGTNAKNRDSSRDWDFMRALIGLVLVSLINRWLKQKNLNYIHNTISLSPVRTVRLQGLFSLFSLLGEQK